MTYIKPIERKYCLIPYIHLITVINPLSKEARHDFSCEWDSYIIIEFGWLKWHFKY